MWQTSQTELANFSNICFCYKNVLMELSESLIHPVFTPFLPTSSSLLDREIGERGVPGFPGLSATQFSALPSDGDFWGNFVPWMWLGWGEKRSV